MRKITLITATLILLVSALMAEDFGSAGASENENFTLEEMFRYALEDEHMALAEYEALMEAFDLTRPYSNIAESEKVHIALLEELYTSYGFEIPVIETQSHLLIPDSPEEAAALGVEAEIKNIAMYDKFMKTNLPDDVRLVFEELAAGSENHLRAFQRQVERSGVSNGGRGRNES